MDDWRKTSAADLGRAIRAGRIDPVDLTEAFLDAIAADPQAGGIYARATPERARAEARAARDRQRADGLLGPLDGVPVSWKDLFDTKGAATEAGTALLADRVPGADARVLTAAGGQGLVCLGKTHMTELAFSGLGLNPVTASPPCINDPDAVSGGSSSGAAASVAFGLAPAAIGSDTAGSVRIPSAWNDLVGLKTVHGRLPLAGVVPLCPRFDTVGPLARSVEDAALLLAVLEGRAGAAPDPAPLGGLRLGVLKTVAMEGLRDLPAQAFDEARRRFETAGARIEEIEVPAVAEAMDLSLTLFAPEAYATWRHLIEARPEAMYAPILARFRSGRDILASDYIGAWSRLPDLRRAYRDATGGFDAVILPTAPIMPPARARLEADPALFAAENLLALRNTRIANLMGLAGLTLPTLTPSAGILFQGPEEEGLLAIGRAAEAVLRA